MIEINLTCPECGEWKFERPNEDDEFECVECHELSLPEDMGSKISSLD